MAAIDQYLQQILEATYGEEVRHSIHDAILENYIDITESVNQANAAATNANTKAQLANTAATNANEKATLANTKAQLADTAAANANEKATLADTAATTANEKATLANTAATNANEKATLANTAATNANEKATLAETAATNADTKAALANTAAQNANTARDTANTAATNANEKATLADTSATRANQAAASAENMTGIVAPTYSASGTYKIGQYTVYNGQLYRCIAEISTAEEWTAAHWTAVPLGNEVSDLKSALSYNGIDNSFNGALYNGYWGSNGSKSAYNSDVCNDTKISCPANAEVIIRANTDATYYISYFGDGDRIRRDTGNDGNYYGVSPSGTKYVCFTFEKAGLNKDNLGHVFVGIGNKIKSIEQQTRYYLTFTDDDLLDGFIHGENGKVYNPNTQYPWKCTDFLPITMLQGGIADIKSTVYSNGGIAFYDSNKVYISGVNGNTASQYGYTADAEPVKRTFQIPEGTFYIRISVFIYASGKASNLFIDTYISSYNIAQTIDEMKNSIYDMNETESMYVNAGANYGHHDSGYSNVDKRFSVLVTTDVHGDIVRLDRAVDYADTMPCFDCGVTLGDIQSSNYNDNDGSWYTNIIKQSKANWLTLVGNHDFGIGSKVADTGTVAQVYDKFISPNLGYMGTIVNSGKCYYYKDFADYGIRVICLNPYDVNNNAISGEDYVVNRYTEYYSQDQVDWLINALNTTPSDYQVIIMVHNAPSPTTKNESIHFNNRILGLSSEGTQSTLIVDIVNAWINGGTLSDIYACSNSNLSSVTVSADFSSRGSGTFVCYLTGHMHIDFVGYITKYNNQVVISLSSTNAGTYQNGGRIDLPRADNTKAEDCITSFSVDTENKNIYLVRVGSSISKWFDKREPSVISYA